MTSPISQTWPIWNKETTKNNLVFSSRYPGSECISYMPLEMQLVLIFGDDEAANNFLHKDAKLLVFLNAPLNDIYFETTMTVLEKNKNKNMYTIPFRVNCGNGEPKFTISHASADTGVHAMVTFSTGKPTNIVGSYLMVTGCLDVAIVSAPCQQCSSNSQ